MRLSDLEVKRVKLENGFSLAIYSDPDPLNPRTDYDNLATFATWHRNARIGERQIEGMNLKAMVKMLKEEGEEVLAILPIWLYDHSGMTIRSQKSGRPGYPFTCQWDSGQVGWAYVTREKAEKMGCTPGATYIDHETKEEKTYDRDYYEEQIIGEVETLDQVMTGQVYGFVVYDRHNEDVDSCWGFIGDDDYCEKEGMSSALSCIEDDKEAHVRFSKDKWRKAVAAEKTELGYEEWVSAQEKALHTGKVA